MLVQAIRIGSKIEIKKLQKALLFEPTLKEPYVIKYGTDKYLVIFKYGVLVFWGLEQGEINETMIKIADYIDSPLENPNKEEMEIKIAGKDSISTDHLELSDIGIEKVAVISEVLSRSVAMEYFEIELENVLKDFGEITKTLSEGGKINLSNRALLKKVGFAMNMQHLIVSQLAMLDKPDITWESSSLDEFYNDLSEEYEIEERYTTLSKKLEIIFRDIEFIMNFLDTRRGFFMELIIILLIAVEIVIFLYEKFLQ